MTAPKFGSLKKVSKNKREIVGNKVVPRLLYPFSGDAAVAVLWAVLVAVLLTVAEP